MDVAALAALAGNALVAAAVTDAWESVRRKIAVIFGRGEPDPRIVERFDSTRAALEAAGPAAAEKVRAEQVAAWTARLTVLLDDHPDAAEDLEALIAAIQVVGPVAADHSVAAGGDVTIIASGGGLAAGVIHGDVTLPGPTASGPADR